MNRRQRRAERSQKAALIKRTGARRWLMPHLLDSYHRPSLNDRQPEDIVWQEVIARGAPFEVGKTYQIDGCFPMTVRAITYEPRGIWSVTNDPCMLVDAVPAVQRVAA